MNELFHLSDKHPRFIDTPRGRGTIQAFDCEDAMARDALLKRMKSKGIQVGPVGDHGVRLRPSLYFEPKHADIFVESLDETCKELA